MPLDLPSKPVEPAKRSIPAGHEYDPKALKPMSRALWATSVALGHALTAYRQVSRLKSVQVSPDGMLGGQGYTMKMDEMRRKLHESCEYLSAISDTLYDEIQAPHWKPQMAKLDESSYHDVETLIEESGAVLDAPEEAAEEDMAALEEDAGPSEAVEQAVKVARAILANSSIPAIGDLPGGPRVDHLGPAQGDGPEGSENTMEPPTDDAWGMGQPPYASNMPREARVARVEMGPNGPVVRLIPASSGMPSDGTPTEGLDFGLGFGAKGQGLNHEAQPASRLPGGPAVTVDDSNPAIEQEVNRKAFSSLPNDTEQPVSRADYSPDYKGNLVNIAESELPGSVPATITNSPGLMGTFEVSEDLRTPYVRFEPTTHQLRQDPVPVR
jgi:hypothetical protein